MNVPESGVPGGPLYFVGVGGAGMSALAQVLAERGQSVAGADPGIAPAVRARLEAAGVRVYGGHDAAQMGEAAAVIVSDAIPGDNPEVRAARERGLPVLRRPELLGALLNAGRGIAIAGTHGKTTTTGMVAHVLLAADLDPTIFLGGDLPALGGNARNGGGDIVLAEACEAYDGFLYMQPEIAVVTNIEADHLDYHGDEAHVLASFDQFIRQVRPGGRAIVCMDDRKAYDLVNSCVPDEGDVCFDTYGINPWAAEAPDTAAAVNAVSIHSEGPRTSFVLRADAIQVNVEDEDWDEDLIPNQVLGRVTLNVPGLHNVRNALAAAAVGLALGIEPSAIIAGLEAFTGTGRRFETLGEEKGALIIDDYAHHPTEIRATLAAARAAYPGRRLVAVFQPHLPSRTRDLMDEFAHSLTGADAVYLTDIYLAREKPLPGVSSEVLAERLRALDRPVVYVPDKNDLPARLADETRPGDLVLTMGAGDIRRAATGLLERLAAA